MSTFRFPAGWRILTNPNQLAARVLKAKYHPHSDFLQATVPRNSSYLWRSIIGARTLLEHGLRWRVGNGRSIRVWHDPWLPEPFSFRVLPSKKQVWPDVRVNDLIDFDTCKWNEQRLNFLFQQDEVDLITRIPLSPCWPPDTLIWHFTRSGVFYVKSSYHLAIELKQIETGKGSSSNKNNEQKLWNSLWLLKIPPKVKIFFWRVCKGSLATGQNFQRRMRNTPFQCSRCGSDLESDRHIFFDCQESRQVWKECGKEYVLKIPGLCSFNDWFYHMLKIMDKPQLEELIILLWLIWKSRNEKLFNGSSWGATKICRYGLVFLHEFQKANLTVKIPSVKPIQHWRPPADNFLKINVDVSYSTIGAGIGMVIRNSTGELEAVFIEKLSACYDAEHVESLAFMKALQFANDYGLTHFVIEGDAANVVNKINKKEDDFSVNGNIIAGIKLMLLKFPNAQIVHISRTINEPARIAAKLALDVPNCKLWFMDFPPSIVSAVLKDFQQ